jgi:hypothetical protein
MLCHSAGAAEGRRHSGQRGGRAEAGSPPTPGEPAGRRSAAKPPCGVTDKPNARAGRRSVTTAGTAGCGAGGGGGSSAAGAGHAGLVAPHKYRPAANGRFGSRCRKRLDVDPADMPSSATASRRGIIGAPWRRLRGPLRAVGSCAPACLADGRPMRAGATLPA